MFPLFAFVNQPAPVVTAPTASGVVYQQLDTIANYLRGYMSDFRNPSFYAYRLDGNGFNITDGGFDMYDSGNVTSPSRPPARHRSPGLPSDHPRLQ